MAEAYEAGQLKKAERCLVRNIPRGYTRVCLKNYSCHPHAPLCIIFLIMFANYICDNIPTVAESMKVSDKKRE